MQRGARFEVDVDALVGLGLEVEVVGDELEVDDPAEVDFEDDDESDEPGDSVGGCGD